MSRRAICMKKRRDSSPRSNGAVRSIVQAARHQGPAHLVLAVPVAPPDTLAALGTAADETVCLEVPIGLGAIGFYYRDFHQMTDAEVTDLLARASAQH